MSEEKKSSGGKSSSKVIKTVKELLVVTGTVVTAIEAIASFLSQRKG